MTEAQQERNAYLTIQEIAQECVSKIETYGMMVGIPYSFVPKKTTENPRTIFLQDEGGDLFSPIFQVTEMVTKPPTSADRKTKTARELYEKYFSGPILSLVDQLRWYSKACPRMEIVFTNSIIPRGIEDACEVIANGKMPIRFVMDYNINTDEMPVRLDVFFGMRGIAGEITPMAPNSEVPPEAVGLRFKQKTFVYRIGSGVPS